MKHSHETCADCNEFPCGKFSKWFDTDSFVTHKNCLPNIKKIKNSGIDEFLKELSERKKLLELILDNFNTGRLMSFYCLASTILSIGSLKNALKKIENAGENRVKSFELLIMEYRDSENISLKLRK